VTATVEDVVHPAPQDPSADDAARDDAADHTAVSAPPRQARPIPAALAPWHDPRPWTGWLTLAALTVLSALTRFWSLGFPHQKIFDEAYYPIEAQELLRFGYEDNRGYMFIVHPPLGKWLIGVGEWWQGVVSHNHTAQGYLDNSLGWRTVPAIFGCLTVIIVARTARRLTRSNLFGAVAGLLIALDGMSLVLSRTALLDVFLEFFVTAAFAALVIDRDKMRARLAGLIADGADLSGGVPSLGPRPWRLLAGVLWGLACAVKWTALSFFVLFVILSWVWDRNAFRAAGVRRTWRATGRRSFLPGLGSLVLAPIGAYLMTYLGWFAGENGYWRHWADAHSASTHLHKFGISIPWTWAWVPAPIRSLGAYTLQAYDFHEGLDSGHVYQSSPWSWLVLGRPVDFYYDSASTQCGSSSCSREILLLGTPLLWWAIVPMLLWLAWHWFSTHDWRAGAIWVAFAAGWLVWFQDLKRTMFLFYMAPLMPFLIYGITLALGTMLGPALRRTGDRFRDHRAWVRRRLGVAGLSVFLALVVVDFAWMWPIFTGALRTYAQWHAHMWLTSWV